MKHLKQAYIILLAILITALLVGRSAQAIPDGHAAITYPKILPTLSTAKFQSLKTMALAAMPYAAQGTYSNDYAWGNCTYYVAGRINVPNNLGDAYNWATMALADGKTTSDVPVKGAVAQTSGGSLGHVAIVEAVQGNQVEVTEMNYAGLDQTDDRWTPISDWTYIYF